jgi:hypothetical protein
MCGQFQEVLKSQRPVNRNRNQTGLQAVKCFLNSNFKLDDEADHQNIAV